MTAYSLEAMDSTITNGSIGDYRLYCEAVQSAVQCLPESQLRVQYVVCSHIINKH